MTQPGDRNNPVEEAIRLLESAAGPMNPMVLLAGPPLSGITRSMYEAVRSGLPHGRLYQLTVAELAAYSDLPSLFSGDGPHVLHASPSRRRFSFRSRSIPLVPRRPARSGVWRQKARCSPHR
ncbi:MULTISPECIES: hypothetical protein [Streptomyces]|uniref:hypothetical protein n=1 Tax=Streptomyces TaxID=1883 RepID=UPI000765CEB2|nr:MULTISPECIES: hypothetical protein [Streptomyces]